jgi:predicted enzyme related to lactoylglutathione lyase
MTVIAEQRGQDAESQLFRSSCGQSRTGDEILPTSLGWNFELGWEYDTPKGRESYWHIKTEHRDESGINGGLTRREYLDQPIGIGVEVTGIDEMLARIEQCGGKILVGKNALPNARLWLAVCKDSEGNTFAMFEVDEAIQSSA